ncbi:MAG: hypothetical protein M0R37_07820 [Bacteroidales bacterium]|nr:hypothetical protein [Bacteroidales bacterium]
MSDEEQRAMILWKTLDVPVGCVAHHCILEQTLRKRGHSGKLWDFRNRLVLTREQHERYHAGFAPLWRDQLPKSVWEFARELDRNLDACGDLDGYFTDWLYRRYPIRQRGEAA